MDAAEEKALSDIEQYGLHVLHVLEEEDLPPFTYTIGVEKTIGHAEFIVIGLKQELAQFVVNECYAKLQAGESIEPGDSVGGLLEGFDCKVVEFPKDSYRDYLGWALWLYKGSNFRAYQIVYPNTSGVWPWEKEADDWFKSWQPIPGGAPCGQVR
ncbi:DUF4262 domain-containing protein [Chitiniphilus eburneus]|uniref:DUF4262 domain-containing protein n=1 Tax=Chitiniphilus eburneus TaxID=2571148 RepID=A0A4U0QBV7_9NEIS|nr:DUF4262 domain-containing protein [Chitiniphilus eburneus]TJZ78891.1 DUF4262 domain-containing protein [Chitiniphilus eburneus]